MAEQKNFQGIEGDLEQFSFPRVLWFLHERSATGRLTIRRGELTKVVFLVDGRAVNVDSTLRDDTLGQYLMKKGKITEEQYQQSIKIMIDQGIQQGAALVKIKALSARDLYHEVKAQTKEKMVSCFAWTKGTFGFYPEVDFVEDIYRFETPMSKIMREGIMRFFPPGAVEKELASVPAEPIAPTPLLAEQLSEFDFNDHETSMIFTITGDKDLLDLKRATKTFPQNLKLIYILLVCGLVGPKGEAAEVVRSLGKLERELPAVESIIGASSEGGEEEISFAPEFDEPEPESTNLSDAVEDIFSEEDAAMDADETPSEPEPDFEPEPPPEEPAHATITEEEVIDDWEGSPGAISGDVKVFGGDEQQAGAMDEPLPPSLRDESEILEFYMDLKGKDFFRLLGIERDADDAAVHFAYKSLRQEWDKHNFGDDISLDAHNKLEEIHAQFIRAYEALRTDDDRGNYIASITKKAKAAVPSKKLEAEKYLQDGVAAVRKRDWPTAEKMFERALEASPGEPEYLGYLGWSVYSNQARDLAGRRERAKTLLRKALSAAPNKDSIRVFLGKILKDEGKADEAVEEFRSALRANPNCKEAEREIRSHELGDW